MPIDTSSDWNYETPIVIDCLRKFTIPTKAMGKNRKLSKKLGNKD